MKPAPFTYLRPQTLEEAVGLLATHGDRAKILAGGQSLVPVMNMRLARPAVLVDINRIEGLDEITLAGGELHIGALCRHEAIERSKVVRASFPVLAKAAAQVGHPQIRTRGTLGGSVVHADPAAELPAVCVAAGATFEITGPSGSRTASAEEFFITYMTVDLQPDEVLTKVRFPLPGESCGWAFSEFSRRAGDFALAAVAALLDTDAAGRITFCRLALAGVADRPIRAGVVEEALLGEKASEALFASASEGLRQALDPDGDLHGSAEYRKDLAVVLTRRALVAALEQKGGAA